MMRLLLLTAAVLFSLQFLLQQQYGKRCGQALSATLAFMSQSSSVGFILLVLLGGLPAFSLCSLLIAGLYALALIGYMYCSQKALEKGTLSCVSLYSMLGGMFLPAGAGFALGEPFSASWAICCGLIAAAVLLSAEGQTGGNILWYSAAFVCNGAVGVLSKLHQTMPSAVDSHSFLAWAYLLNAVGCCALYFLRKKTLFRFTGQACWAVGYACCNTAGNLLSLTALLTLPASEQYPIMTGGGIFFCGILGLFLKERLTPKKVAAILLSVAGTVILAL